MTTLKELAVMLDEAAGPSRDLDHAISFATNWEGSHDRWSSSIDAALALVKRLLPGWEWSMWRVGETCGATVYNTPEDEISNHAPTAPIAILKALVSALIAKEAE